MTDGVLELPNGARALFASRRHGNLSSVGGERHEHGACARERLRRALGLERIVRGYQVHGALVVRHGQGLQTPFHADAATAEATVHADAGAVEAPIHADAGAVEATIHADGHAVAEPDVAAMVLVADCVPVVLAARGAVAALHAGWRGLAAGVLEEGMRALRDVGGEGSPLAVIGPCAGACCYEVGEDVHGALATGLQAGDRIDLRAIARRRLLAAGAAEVRDVQACTICDERYFSHRREGTCAGRQAALAWLT